MRALFALFNLSVSGFSSETCYLPIDLVILQDTTGSFVDDLPNVSRNIPSLVSRVLEQNPQSWFGASEFKDKPYRDLGEPTDYCYRQTAPLSGNVTRFQEAWDTLYATAGGDIPEGQLHALINVAQDPEVNWRPLRSSMKIGDADTAAGARVVIMSTDAGPHDPGDYTLYQTPADADVPRPPAYMPPFPSDTAGISIRDQCTVYDYPNFEQAAAAIKAANVQVVFLVPEAETKAVEKWQEFNEKYLGQPPHFLQYIKPDSSDFVDVVLKAVKEVTNYICYSTTTAAPTTPSATRPISEPTTAPTSTPSATRPLSEPTTAPTTTPSATRPISEPSTAPTTTPSATRPISEPTTAPTTTPSATRPISEPTTGTTTTSTASIVVPTVSTAGTPATATLLTPPVTETLITSVSTKVSYPACDCHGNVDCGCAPALIVRVNDRPHKLSIDYVQ